MPSQFKDWILWVIGDTELDEPQDPIRLKVKFELGLFGLKKLNFSQAQIWVFGIEFDPILSLYYYLIIVCFT